MSLLNHCSFSSAPYTIRVYVVCDLASYIYTIYIFAICVHVMLFTTRWLFNTSSRYFLLRHAVLMDDFACWLLVQQSMRWHFVCCQFYAVTCHVSDGSKIQGNMGLIAGIPVKLTKTFYSSATKLY